MRFSLLFAFVALVWCGQVEARTNWIQSQGLPCETVCRNPVTVGGRPDAYVCAGHVQGAPPTEIRSGMIAAGGRYDAQTEADKVVVLTYRIEKVGGL